MLLTGKYNLIIWFIIAFVALLNFFRYLYYHRKLYMFLKEKEPNVFNEISNAPPRYRKFIFADNGSDDKEIEYCRIQARESLKLLLLFTVIFFGFMLIVAILG